MSRITVMPGADDRRVPVEGAHGQYFPHGEPREVELTHYIRRRLADGDLVEVKPAANGPAVATTEPAKE